jgi:hypothetical protein
VAQSRAEPQELPGETKLTQYGEKPPVGEGFRDRLRVDIGETEMSMILGEVDAAAASMLVAKHLVPGAITRTTTVARLEEAGFRVIHSPTRGNPLHVSVFPPRAEASGDAEWGDNLAQSFNACFTEAVQGRRRR